MKYRKKPIVIDAHEFDGTERGMHECRLLLEHNRGQSRLSYMPARNGQPSAMLIQTLEGVMCASAGDMIIRGVKGELYSCTPEVFALTYEAVDEPE